MGRSRSEVTDQPSRSALRWFRIIAGTTALIPVYLATRGFLCGAGDTAILAAMGFDSTLRFLYAMMLGWGLSVVYMMRSPGKYVGLFRLHLAVLFLGGLGRAYSHLFVAPQSSLATIVMFIELGLPVLLGPWHAWLFRRRVSGGAETA